MARRPSASVWCRSPDEAELLPTAYAWLDRLAAGSQERDPLDRAQPQQLYCSNRRGRLHTSAGAGIHGLYWPRRARGVASLRERRAPRFWKKTWPRHPAAHSGLHAAIIRSVLLCGRH